MCSYGPKCICLCMPSRVLRARAGRLVVLLQQLHGLVHSLQSWAAATTEKAVYLAHWHKGTVVLIPAQSLNPGLKPS